MLHSLGQLGFQSCGLAVLDFDNLLHDTFLLGFLEVLHLFPRCFQIQLDLSLNFLLPDVFEVIAEGNPRPKEFLGPLRLILGLGLKAEVLLGFQKLGPALL